MKLKKDQLYRFVLDGWQPNHGLISFEWEGFIRKGQIDNDGMQVIELDLQGEFKRIEKHG